MPKLWRRTPKAQRNAAALANHFSRSKHPAVQLISLLQRAAVPVLYAHDYIRIPSSSPAAMLNASRRAALAGKVQEVAVNS